jgi:hypothetical protein
MFTFSGLVDRLDLMERSGKDAGAHLMPALALLPAISAMTALASRCRCPRMEFATTSGSSRSSLRLIIDWEVRICGLSATAPPTSGTDPASDRAPFEF